MASVGNYFKSRFNLIFVSIEHNQLINKQNISD